MSDSIFNENISFCIIFSIVNNLVCGYDSVYISQWYVFSDCFPEVSYITNLATDDKLLDI